MCVPPHELRGAHYQRISSGACSENRFSGGGNNAPEWVATIVPELVATITPEWVATIVRNPHRLDGSLSERLQSKCSELGCDASFITRKALENLLAVEKDGQKANGTASLVLPAEIVPHTRGVHGLQRKPATGGSAAIYPASCGLPCRAEALQSRMAKEALWSLTFSFRTYRPRTDRPPSAELPLVPAIRGACLRRRLGKTVLLAAVRDARPVRCQVAGGWHSAYLTYDLHRMPGDVETTWLWLVCLMCRRKFRKLYVNPHLPLSDCHSGLGCRMCLGRRYQSQNSWNWKWWNDIAMPLKRMLFR